MGPRAIARGNGLLRSAGEGRTSAIRKSDFPVGISHFPTGKAISLSAFRISRQEKRFPSRHFAFPDGKKRFPSRHFAFPDRKSDFPLRILHFPTGKSDFPLGISHFPISKSDFLIAGVARLGKVGNRWHPSFNGAARDRARKAAEP